ncbi:MAG: hypothetical protein RL755_759 [Pseudomonadota bacterium]|jgi:hypothetical protein
MLEVQAVSAAYPMKKSKKIHKDDYRMPEKSPKRKLKLSDDYEEEHDDTTPSEHIDIHA